jgi:hypothetical protein
MSYPTINLAWVNTLNALSSSHNIALSAIHGVTLNSIPLNVWVATDCNNFTPPNSTSKLHFDFVTLQGDRITISVTPYALVEDRMFYRFQHGATVLHGELSTQMFIGLLLAGLAKVTI